jgi:hypothetical protein
VVGAAPIMREGTGQGRMTVHPSPQ